MTSALRKAHKYSWLLLILLIPLIMIFALKDVPLLSNNEALTTFESSKGNIIKTAENDLLKVSVRSNSIEVILKRTIKNASSIIYNSDSKGNKNHIIGQISTVGIYTFNIETPPKSIVLYDNLKGELITKLDF